MCSERKGYTLIELLICLGLMGLVTVLLMSFFTANLNNFVKVKNDSELQFQSQYVLNFISKKVMESKKVSDVRIDNTTSMINSKREVSAVKISLLYNEQKGSCYIFEVKGNKIFYFNGKTGNYTTAELGTYISELRVAPYPQGKTFAQAPSLVITIRLMKDKQVYEATQIISMRSF